MPYFVIYLPKYTLILTSDINYYALHYARGF